MQRFDLLRATFFLSALGVAACGGGLVNGSARTPVAEKWLDRARQSYRNGDADDATVAIDGALNAAPHDREVRLLGARVALAKLDFDEAIKLTEGLDGTDAKSVRGRALWYSGDIERAADELDEVLKDPLVKDPWARDVAKLSRRGMGRHPFAIEGASVAAVDMPGSGGSAIVVPCELEGERILALVATKYSELMIDSASRKEPAWVNLRIGDQFELKDVPALTQDLSAISHTLGAPIKALIGVNVLRHLHATIDRHGSQFVVRKSDPLPPPDATKLPVFYARGDSMMLQASLSNKDNALLFVDSSAVYTMALEDSLFKRAGADLTTFRTDPGGPPTWKVGPLPYFKLGGVDIAGIFAVQGAPVSEYKENLDVDLGGVAGASLLSIFRITFGDEGKWLWLEPDPTVFNSGPPQAAPPGPSAPAAGPSPTLTLPKTEKTDKVDPLKMQPEPKARPAGGKGAAK
jgi:hypothetical protein